MTTVYQRKKQQLQRELEQFRLDNGAIDMKAAREWGRKHPRSLLYVWAKGQDQAEAEERERRNRKPRTVTYTVEKREREKNLPRTTYYTVEKREPNQPRIHTYKVEEREDD